MTRTPPTLPTLMRAAGALAALMVAAGCASSSLGRPAASPPPTTASAASPSPSSPAQQALAAYRAMWADVVAASATSDYQATDLTDHLAGQALVTLTENMAVLQAHGIIALGSPTLHPNVITTSPTSITLRDCLDDTHWLQYYASTHQLVDNTPGGHRYTTATIQDQAGIWKVTEMTVEADGTCTAPTS